MASDAASTLNDPLASAERRERARSVASDLEAIFGEREVASRPQRRVARPIRGVRDGTAGPKRLSAASMGGIAAAALAGIAAGALLVKGPARPDKSPTHPAALPIELVPAPSTPQASDAALAAPDQPLDVRPAPPPALPRATAPAERSQPRGTASRADIMAADRRLRAAYATAIRAGVPRSTLAEHRDRWSSVRRRDAHDPGRLVASYRDIAADLNRAVK